MNKVHCDEPRRKDRARLVELIGGVRSLDEVSKRLGPPDRDTATQEPPIVGENVPRIVVWTNVSDYWVVRVCAWGDGRFNSALESRELWVAES